MSKNLCFDTVLKFKYKWLETICVIHIVREWYKSLYITVCHYTLVYISLYITVCHCIMLYVTACHCMSLYFTVCHCMSLCVTVCHCMSLYVTVCHCTLLLLKEVGSARLRENDIRPISPKTPAAQYQPIDRKKSKGKIAEANYSRNWAA